MTLALLGLFLLVPAWMHARAHRVEIENRLPWHGSGVWLAGDPHVHRVLDGAYGAAILDAARAQGLDFVASTEHAQEAFDANSADRVRALRAAYPGLLLLAGIEWNVPAGDHATVVLEETPQEVELLREFARRFDRRVNPELQAEQPPLDPATWGGIDRAVSGIRWLAELRQAGGPAVAVYLNHLCRWDYLDPPRIAALCDAGLAGIESAPGHQKRSHPGEPRTIDRHDPFMLAGGGYDWLSASGRHVGLAAGSDFHHAGSAYRPGEFSRTLVYAPDRSSRGVVEGLAAGTTATVLGGIVDRVETFADAGGGEEATIGETLVVAAGSTVRYTVRLQIPERDAWGRPNRVDRVEVISDFAGRPDRVWVFGDVEPGPAVLEVDLPRDVLARAGSFFVRVSGRRFVGGPGSDSRNADFQFHVAPTRIRVKEPSLGQRAAAVVWPWS